MAFNVKTCTLVILAVALTASAAPTASLLQLTKKTTGAEKSQQQQSQDSKKLMTDAEDNQQLQIQEHKALVTGAKKTQQLQSENPKTSTDETKQYAKEGGEGSTVSRSSHVLLQLLFGIFYYIVVVSKYPLPVATPITWPKKARRLQNMNAVSATCEVSLTNCFLSYCCSGPRAAHTFYATGIANYWVSLIGMSCIPCCFLFAANACTDLNERLGGERQGIIMGIICAFCCSCCLIAQDAETLDLINGVKTGCCGVTDDV